MRRSAESHQKDRQKKKNWIGSRMRWMNIIEIDKEGKIDGIGKI